ncbi:hypothetical protein Tco_0054895, partial [Tanacetum coccineum]
VSTVSSAGTQIKSGSSRFNTGKQHVNSGTQIKSGSSRFNTGKQNVNSGSSTEAYGAHKCGEIHTDLNVADLLIKPFDGRRFNYLVVSIGMINP